MRFLGCFLGLLFYRAWGEESKEVGAVVEGSGCNVMTPGLLPFEEKPELLLVLRLTDPAGPVSGLRRFLRALESLRRRRTVKIPAT